MKELEQIRSLIQLLGDAGWSRGKVARRLGVTTGAVGRWMSDREGGRQPRMAPVIIQALRRMLAETPENPRVSGSVPSPEAS